MALTGRSEGPPALPAGPVASRLQALVDEIAQRTARHGAEVRLVWGAVLTARAAELGLRRNGQVSANRSCRLLKTTDGWIACNLPRPEDRDCVEALVGHPPGGALWGAVIDTAARAPTARFVSQARLLGLAVAPLARPVGVCPPWTVERRWEAVTPRPLDGLRVVDLSSLWAGPLTAHILMAAGAEVCKVEAASRREGANARPGPRAWLPPGDPARVVIDLATVQGRRQLFQLVDQADVVIEASRPRALEQLGCDPGSLPPRPGRVWLSITGYGRSAPGRDWVAFGDDAAVAGGLVAWDAAGVPLFAADAIADPVTGLMGTVAVLRSVEQGGGHLLDLAMVAAASFVAHDDNWGRPPPGLAVIPVGDGSWELDARGRRTKVAEAAPPGPPLQPAPLPSP